LPATTRDRGVLNFYAGPTTLPWPVIERMREDIVDFHGTRMGVMEISHRAPEIEGLLADTAARVRRLLGVNADAERHAHRRSRHRRRRPGGTFRADPDPDARRGRGS
jgi:hypothetical protein